MLRTLAAVAALAGAIAAATPAGAGPVPEDEVSSDAGVPIVVIDGKGHGHGIGLSQWGAHALARQGSSATAIISTFYPGTTLGQSGGEVAVGIDTRAVVTVAFPTGGELRTERGGGGGTAGFPLAIAPGGTVRVRATGAGLEVVDAAALGADAVPFGPTQDCGLLCPPGTTTTTTTTTTPDGTTTTAPGATSTTTTPSSTTTSPDTSTAGPTSLWAVPNGGVVTAVDRGRSYRGVFQLTGTSAVSLTNRVDVEDYLRGMTEVPGHWPAAAVQAQVIAARTYALRAVAGGGSICDSDSCQVYVGTARESPGLDAAVAATSGTVVLYGGSLAATYYSASAGGVSATPAEGFGLDNEVAYLQAVEHPDDNPQPWTVEIALDEFGRRFGYPGTIEGVEVSEVGPSGRALTITMFGDAGEATIVPDQFRRQLGLRSTLYTIDDGVADEAPEAPNPDDQSAAVVGADGRGAVGIVQAPIAGDALVVDASLSRPPGRDAATTPLAVLAGAAILAAGAALGRHTGRLSVPAWAHRSGRTGRRRRHDERPARRMSPSAGRAGRMAASIRLRR